MPDIVSKNSARKRKRKTQDQDPVNPHVWTKPLLRRKHKLIKAGDDEGLLKLNLGRYICNMRLSQDWSQEEAATRADIGRGQWNRIEMGHVRPHLNTLESIADAFHTDVSRLKERAGYAGPKVPLDVGHAFRRFCKSIEHSRYTVQFLMDMCLLWQEFKAEEFRMPKSLEVDIRIPEVVSFVRTRLAMSQQLQLAVELVDGFSVQALRLEKFDRLGFIQLIDLRIRERRILQELVKEYEESESRKDHSET
jgi:transcriptional regulator with XRE-family HTH domain